MVNECYAYQCMNPQECQFYGFKDCVNFGGYSWSMNDQCMQTCRLNEEKDWKEEIGADCVENSNWQGEEYDWRTGEYTSTWTDEQRDLWI